MDQRYPLSIMMLLRILTVSFKLWFYAIAIATAIATPLVLVAMVAALTFSVTLNQKRDTVTLRYPVADKVAWVETCLYQIGHTESEGDWDSVACWNPSNDSHRVTEQVKLKAGVNFMQATLEISEEGHHSILQSPAFVVHPKEEPNDR